MKVAYHFNCTGITSRYDKTFYDILFNRLLGFDEQFISTKILVGDLSTYDFKIRFQNPEQFLNNLFQENNDTWKRILYERKSAFIEKDVFVICFETITKDLANKLHESLIDTERYLGAFEIDNSYRIHWWLYGECIGTKFRLLNRNISIFIDNDEIENKEYAEFTKELLKGILFDKVDTEFSNYRRSIFDDNHNFENAKRAAEWRKSTESIFSTVTDEIISKLTDSAPELTDRLWAINQSFINAKIGEQYAQAMTSCRRVFEYVTDCLFPATDKIIDGHNLKKDKYKNRLFQFASEQLKSNTNIELIIANTASLFDEWNNLYELSNKGVHNEPHRQECRRCIIRTILLLDDLIALKQSPFEVTIKSDKFINDFKEKHNASR